MGGNVKDAFTDPVMTTTDCKVCGNSFEHKYKRNRSVCQSCKSRLNDPTNLATELTSDIDATQQEITIELCLQSTVNDNVSIEFSTNSVEREEIVCVFRIEGDNGAWYEDAWVEDTRFSYHLSVSRGSFSREFVWPSDTTDTESVRSEYQNAVGNLFEAETLTVTVSFTDPQLEDIEETIDMPSYVIDL
jgi:hypothetical protein